MGNARGTLKEACTRFPPLLHGVHEERGGCLSCQVARSGACSDLVARCPPWRQGVRRQLFERFSPGEVGVPGSPQIFFQGSPPRVWVYKILFSREGAWPVAASSQPPLLTLPRWAGIIAVDNPPWVPMWVQSIPEV